MNKGMMYTDEERALGGKLCEAVNEDKELKAFFAQTASHILTNYAVGAVRAHKGLDTKKRDELMQVSVDMFKALTMHVLVKVMPKMKEAK